MLKFKTCTKAGGCELESNREREREIRGERGEVAVKGGRCGAVIHHYLLLFSLVLRWKCCGPGTQRPSSLQVAKQVEVSVALWTTSTGTGGAGTRSERHAHISILPSLLLSRSLSRSGVRGQRSEWRKAVLLDLLWVFKTTNRVFYGIEKKI